MEFKVALAGNPNCGKTTLFNALTGSNQYVGNWAGVTVEKKSGKFKVGADTVELVDLPGIYSLSPYTMEEVITRDFIADEHPDVVLNIIDGTNMERNLYLTLQLMELGIPMVIAVNMMDELTARGDVCDYEGIARDLGVSVVPISAKKGTNIELLCSTLIQDAKQQCMPSDIPYDSVTHGHIEQIEQMLVNVAHIDKQHLAFYAAKLLEGDQDAAKKLQLAPEMLQKIEAIAAHYETTSRYGDRETMVADARYRFIESLIAKRVQRKLAPGQLTLSDKIDKFATNRFLAIPIFLLIMLVMFLVTFGTVGSTLSDWVEYLMQDVLSPGVQRVLEALSAPQWTQSLLIDGVIAGVGSVLSFLPQITLLFLFLSVLEDSGYMARAAFVMDSFLRKMGLNGKAFIPMLMGFGCSVPAIMAARTMENDSERKMTIMLVPFMSCAARMPVYALFAGALFASHQGIIVFGLYILGIVVAILTGLALKKTLFKKNDAPFLLELPPYRLPSLRTLGRHVWDKCRDFIVRAGTLILAMTVIVWVLQNFTPSLKMADNSQDSILGVIGTFLAPVFIPLGFGTWQAVVALLSGVVAKEAIVSSLIVLYAAESQAALGTMLSGVFTPLSALSFLVFVLLYIPCVASISAMRREMNSWKWCLGALAMQLGIAYAVSLLVYQIGALIV